MRTSILLADDDAVLRDVLVELLRDAGYVVYEAGNGQQAVRLARRIRPQLILMDLRMPVLDGVAAIRQLKAEPATQQIPLIVLSAEELDHPLRQQVPADHFVAKPFDSWQLLALIADLAPSDT